MISKHCGESLKRLWTPRTLKIAFWRCAVCRRVFKQRLRKAAS